MEIPILGIYMRLLSGYEKNKDGNIFIVRKRIINLPLVISLLIVAYTIFRLLLVNLGLFYFAEIYYTRIIIRLLIILITSTIVAVLSYALLYLASHTYLSSLSQKDRLFSNDYLGSSITRNIIVINVLSIAVPAIIILLSFFLYTIVHPSVQLKLGLFVFIGIAIVGLFIGLQILYSYNIYNKMYSVSTVEKIPDILIEQYHITSRENEIIGMLLKGMSNREIADKLEVSVRTVKNHIYNIFLKTGVNSRFKLINLLKR
jgi:DNA-binding CsgD family transcriptional regulator